jgi:2-oxo-3-hexenedioate decarboxylase
VTEVIEVADYSRLADMFAVATATGQAATRPTESWPDVTLDDAYAIQFETVSKKLADGDTVRAIKLGLTQQTEQDQWSIPHPTFGTLTTSMLLEPGEPFQVSRGHAPKVEAEVVVVIATDILHRLESVDELMPFIGSIHAGIEILDSRYHHGDFHPVDAVADNQSALSGVWRLEGLSPTDIDLVGESAKLFVDGVEKGSGVASRLLGNPLNAVLGAVNEMVRLGRTVPGGIAIFSGNLCQAAVPVAAGNEVQVRFSTLGSLTLQVVD